MQRKTHAIGPINDLIATPYGISPNLMRSYLRSNDNIYSLKIPPLDMPGGRFNFYAGAGKLNWFGLLIGTNDCEEAVTNGMCIFTGALEMDGLMIHQFKIGIPHRQERGFVLLGSGSKPPVDSMWEHTEVSFQPIEFSKDLSFSLHGPKEAWVTAGYNLERQTLV